MIYLKEKLSEAFRDLDIPNGSLDSQNDLLLADTALQEFLGYIQDKANTCLNASANNGICDLIWKHDVCLSYLDIMYEITGDNKYNKEKNSILF